MLALEDHPIDPIRKGWRGTVILFYPQGICNFLLNRKGPEDQGRTEYKHTRRKKKLKTNLYSAKGTPMQAIYCEPQTAASHYRCK